MLNMGIDIDAIDNYRNKSQSANTESAKKELLVRLLQDLFGDNSKARNILDEMSLGAERAVFNIPKESDGENNYGLADTQYRDIIIEFKSDLDKQEEDAKDQLKDYLSGNWNSGDEYDFTLLATDGVNWKKYTPDYDSIVGSEKLKQSDITLSDVSSIDLTDEEYEGFYFFLDRWIFQVEEKKAGLESIKRDFGEKSNVFINCLDKLSEHFEEVKNDTEVETAYDNWVDFLSIAYGSFNGSKDIFLTHTYLSIFSKILAFHLVTGEEAVDESEMTDIIDGSKFEELNVENFVDRDFFGWISDDRHFSALKQVFRAISYQISLYDFSVVEEDVLKGVYQELTKLDVENVQAELGEHYTPDWLCERMLQEYDFEKDSKVLDPACGSGSFLRAAIEKFKDEHPDLSVSDMARNVAGIDIHPLSVQISKTTILLALGEEVQTLKRPLQLRVYLANTILTPTDEVGLFGEEFKMTIDGEGYYISSKIFNDPGVFDTSTNVCNLLADSTKGDETVSEEVLENSLTKRGVDDLDSQILSSFHKIYRGIKQAKEEGRDGIWRFIVQNLYKPYFMNNQFDYVVGNPPWITYKDVKNEDYQDRLRDMAEERNVIPENKKNMTHLEIASIFLSHCSSYFLKRGGDIGFVLPRSFFSGMQHGKIRQGKADWVKIKEMWDLENVSPLFNTVSCVIFAKSEPVNKDIPDDGCPGYVVEGRLPKQNMNWKDASSHITFNQTTYYYGQLGSLSAFTDYNLNAGGRTNFYKSKYRQGATITPRNFYFVEFAQDAPPDFDDRIVSVKTNEERRKRADSRWKENTLSGRVNSDFLFYTALSNSLIPFGVVDLKLILAPVIVESDEPKVVHWENMRKEGYIKTSSWFKKVEKYWEENKTEKSSDMTYIDRIDYQSELTEQNLGDRYLVLYPSSSSRAFSGILDRERISTDFLIEHKSYHYGTNNKEEAYFLCGFLNSRVTNEIVADFQSRGLFGKRDIHKKILEVPLPKYDSSNNKHRSLVKASKKAEKIVQSSLDKYGDLHEMWHHKLGNVRSNILDDISGIISKIDSNVKDIVDI